MEQTPPAKRFRRTSFVRFFGNAALGAALCAASLPAWAARHSFTLAPGSVQLRFRAYSLGVIPIEGGFQRFSGTLVLDDADPAFCTLTLTAQAASLAMPTQAMTEVALGTDLLDVTRFPAMQFSGRCAGGTLDGTLDLHGVSKPLRMAVTESGGAWAAAGTVHRADWGMGAKPMLAGPDVRISLTAGLPADMRAAP